METQKEVTKSELETLKSEKLWHQLTLKLLEYVKDKNVQKNVNLLTFYDEFIRPIESKMNCVALVEIISYIISFFNEPEEAVTFLESVETLVKGSVEALIFAKVLKGDIILNKLKNLEDCLVIIVDVEKLFDDLETNLPVHSLYYSFACQVYRCQKNFTEFYKTCLKYLGSTDLSTISTSDQAEHAFLLGVSALVSDDVYNLGEILIHPVLQSLVTTPNEWLIKLLNAFNNGNIQMFFQLMPKWRSVPDMASHENKLKQKIAILCLMDRAIKQQAKSKFLTFQEIAKETELPLDQVEFLIMRTMSLGLVKGKIDEVNKEVFLEWVKPRIIDNTKIAYMVNRLDLWCAEVNIVQNRQDEAQEFLIANNF